MVRAVPELKPRSKDAALSLPAVPAALGGGRNRVPLDNEALKALDLRQFNEGRNPYAEGDNSVANAFRQGTDYYRDFVGKMTGFRGGDRVLDLLCGFGRLSLFLAEQNREVIGLDVSPDCIRLARNMTRAFGFDNIRYLCGDVAETRRFPDEHFDYVWMYSALQYVDRGAVLREANRVLRPGGRLFVGNYNSTGLMLSHLMNGIERNAINEGASQWALSALVHGPEHDGNPNYASLAVCEALCERFGFALVKAAPQGLLDLSRPGGLRDDFRPRRLFDHYESTIEFVAEKQGAPQPPSARAKGSSTGLQSLRDGAARLVRRLRG